MALASTKQVPGQMIEMLDKSNRKRTLVLVFKDLGAFLFVETLVD